MRRTRSFSGCGVLAVAWFCGIVLGEGTSSSLLVQQALREAQACLQQGEPGTAVRLLERQLPYINGNAAYLDLLAQAYDQYLAQLHQLSRLDLIPTYLERLAILNPARAAALRREWQLEGEVQPATRLVARGRLDEEPVLHEFVRLESYPQFADQAFSQGQYRQARLYYWRAIESRQSLTTLHLQRWAYCSWWEIYQLLHASPSGWCDWSVILLEANRARQHSNDWAFAVQILREVERRQAVQKLPIRHVPEPCNAWYVSESPHFRIYHRDVSLAEHVLRLAEHVHAMNSWFWFGELVPPHWESPCEIYLHPNADSFSRATNVAPGVSAFSTIAYDRNDAHRVLSRRMDVRADAADLLTRLVPHETTHISLAGRFGPRPLPRWADEGLALLAEPEEIHHAYRHKVYAAAPRGQLIPLAQLLTREDYSPQLDLQVFYGQSLLLVEYLLERGGKWSFVHFITEAHRLGWEPALRRYYQVDSLSQLEQIFHRKEHSSSASRTDLRLPHDFHSRLDFSTRGWTR